MPGWRTRVLGTDLSQEVLEKAKTGLYSQFEVQRGLPIQMLLKYFDQKGDMWQINAGMRAMIEWKQLNLLESFTHLGEFDIVFCRNVLIYFDQATKSEILGRLSRTLPDDGYLVLGAAETVVGLTDAFKPVPGKRGLFQKKQAVQSSDRVTCGTEIGRRRRRRFSAIKTHKEQGAVRWPPFLLPAPRHRPSRAPRRRISGSPERVRHPSVQSQSRPSSLTRRSMVSNAIQ